MQHMSNASHWVRHGAGHRVSVAAGLGLLAVLLLAGAVAQAATFTWDTVPGTVGVGNGTITSVAGTWDTSTGNWTSDGGANNVAWNNANLDSASFSYVYSGPYTVTLGANVTAGSIVRPSPYNGSNPITIDPDAGGLYKITLDPPTKSGSFQVTIDDAQTRLLIINAPIELAGWTHQFRGKVTVNGAISGNNKLRYNTSYPASDALTLTGNNTFNGGFELDQGTKVVVGHDNALGTGTFIWNLYGKLEATNGDRVITNNVPEVNLHIKRTVTGANDITFTGSYNVKAYTGTEYASLDVQDSGCVVTFRNFHTAANGASTGAGFKKLGAGTMVIENSFTVDSGSPLPFTVEGGALFMDATAQVGAVVVSNGATLGGTGTLELASGAGVTVASGASLAPGGSAGTLTITNGPLNFAENAIYEWEFDASAGDLAQVYGDLVLPSVATVNVSLVGGALPSNATIFSATSLSGPGAADVSNWVITGDAAPGAAATISGGGKEVVLTGLVPSSGTVVSIR